MTIENLEPKRVWKHFYSLTRIPRPSKREQKAVEYLYQWGQSLGLETIPQFGPECYSNLITCALRNNLFFCTVCGKEHCCYCQQ